MAWASTVPGAITALVTMLQAAPALAGVEVNDGPPMGNSAAMEAIGVGYTAEEDIPAVDSSVTVSSFSGFPESESYTVHCSLAVVTGDRLIASSRARAYELYAAIGEVLAAQGVPGTMSAGLADHSLSQEDTDRGMLARINFGIQVTASIRR